MSLSTIPAPTIRAYVVTSLNEDSLYVCPTCHAAHYQGVWGWEALPLLALEVPACEECGVTIDGP